MKFGSLFSGIGGLDLGLEMSGMECAWQVEVDEFCQKILKTHWPNTEVYGNIFELDGKELEPVDVICGGFPCQPVSLAGQRAGTSDKRWLWPEFARIIRQVRPRWIVAENVTGLLSANSGRAFAEVLRDLAESRYDAVWDVFPSGGPSGVGAPHRRERIFIIGKLLENPNGRRRSRKERTGEDDLSGSKGEESNSDINKTGEGCESGCSRPAKVAHTNSSKQATQSRDVGEVSGVSEEVGADIGSVVSGGGSKDVADTDSYGEGIEDVADSSSKSKHNRSNSKSNNKVNGIQSQESRDADRKCSGKNVANTDSAQRKGGGISSRIYEEYPDFGGTSWWEVEPDVGRVANGVPNRVDRLRSLGNAVVPQVAKQIGDMIMGQEM